MAVRWSGKRCGKECVSCSCGRDHSVKCKWAKEKGWKEKVVRDRKAEKKAKKAKRKKK